MSLARKCDRCGKFFDPADVNGMMCYFRNPVFLNSADFKNNTISRFMMENEPFDENVDLCPGCGELFETFMCMGEPKADAKADEPYNPLNLAFKNFMDSLEEGLKK